MTSKGKASRRPRRRQWTRWAFVERHGGGLVTICQPSTSKFWAEWQVAENPRLRVARVTITESRPHKRTRT